MAQLINLVHLSVMCSLLILNCSLKTENEKTTENAFQIDSVQT
jgi:hypothetical protein